MFGQRMAGEIEAQHFLFVGKPLLVGPIGSLHERGIGRLVDSSSASSSNRPFWPALRSANRLAPACMARSSDCHSDGPIGVKLIEGPGLDQAFDGGAVDAPMDRSARRNRTDCGTVRRLCGLAAIASPAAPPQPLIAARPNRILPLGHGEIGFRAVHIRRHHFDVHPPAIFQMLDQRILLLEVAAVDVAREQGRHELDRIMGLEIGRHVGDQGVGRAVRLVEAVAGELSISSNSSSACFSLSPCFAAPSTNCFADTWRSSAASSC